MKDHDTADFFVHPQSLCETKQIGKGTRIWAFAHILPGAQIGEECNICDCVFIENDVVIGNRVTIKNGVQLWDGIKAEDDVFIGPNATFTNDRFPRSKEYPETFERTLIQRGASIGANATILPGINIGQQAMIGAGAVVTQSVPPYAIVAGNPALIISYVAAGVPEPINTPVTAPVEGGVALREIDVKGVTLHTLPYIKDIRGDLCVGEFERNVPFKPKRYFVVHNVPTEETRGQHAHQKCEQFLVCIRGRCAVVVDDGTNRREILLDQPSLGLYIPPMTWGIQYKFSPDAMLLVLASDYYDPADYLRKYQDFLLEIGKS
jgi:acetyltransferase-like isoleucine patch superfamily enzyme/dTDP-4-dehydrorhamnose 3,5-epimerase-like enzyme